MYKILCVWEYDCVYFKFEQWVRTEKELNILKMCLFYLDNKKHSLSRDKRLKIVKFMCRGETRPESIINAYYNNSKCLCGQDKLQLLYFEYDDEKYKSLFKKENSMGYNCLDEFRYYGRQNHLKKFVWDLNTFNHMKNELKIELIATRYGPVPF